MRKGECLMRSDLDRRQFLRACLAGAAALAAPDGVRANIQLASLMRGSISVYEMSTSRLRITNRIAIDKTKPWTAA